MATISWFGRNAPDNVGFDLVTTLAGERNRSNSAASYIVTTGEWQQTTLNPHTSAAVGTLTAGTAGNTELLISATPIILDKIIFAGDTAAGSVYLYDKSATGGSGVPYPILYNAAAPVILLNGWKTTNGLTVIGTAAGVSCTLLWRPV